MASGMDDIWAIHVERMRQTDAEEKAQEENRLAQIRELKLKVKELECKIKEKEIKYMDEQKDFIYGMPREELFNKIQKEFFTNIEASATKPDKESIRMWQSRSDEAMKLFGLLKEKPEDFIEKEEMEL